MRGVVGFESREATVRTWNIAHGRSFWDIRFPASHIPVVTIRARNARCVKRHKISGALPILIEYV
jgi:hypothetical protein